MHDFMPVQQNLPLLAAFLTQLLTSRQRSAKSDSCLAQAMVVVTVKDARKHRERWPVLLGNGMVHVYDIHFVFESRVSH